LAAPLSKGRDPVNGNLIPGVAAARWPADLNSFHFGSVAQPKVYSRIVSGQITAISPDPALDGSSVFSDQLNGAAISGAVGARSFETKEDPVTTVRRGIQEQARGAVVVGDQDIDSPVIVDVAKHGGAAYIDVIQRRTRGSCYILKALSGAQVAEQQIPFTVRVGVVRTRRRPSPDCSVGAEHVQQPPVLDIQEADSETRVREGGLKQPRLDGGIHEIAVRLTIEQSESFTGRFVTRTRSPPSP